MIFSMAQMITWDKHFDRCQENKQIMVHFIEFKLKKRLFKTDVQYV